MRRREQEADRKRSRRKKQKTFRKGHDYLRNVCRLNRKQGCADICEIKILQDK